MWWPENAISNLDGQNDKHRFRTRREAKTVLTLIIRVNINRWAIF